MTTKKKIILTILLVVLVGVLITWFVGQIYSIKMADINLKNNIQWVNEMSTPVDTFYINYYKAELIKEIVKTIFIVFLLFVCILILINVWNNFIIIKFKVNQTLDRRKDE